MGIKVGVRKVVDVVVTSVTVFAKVSDRGSYALKDQYGEAQ